MGEKPTESSTTDEALLLGKAFLLSELKEKNERLDELIETHEKQLEADREAFRQEYAQQLKHLNTQVRETERLRSDLQRLIMEVSEVKRELTELGSKSRRRLMDEERWLTRMQDTVGNALRFHNWFDGIVKLAGIASLLLLATAALAPLAARIIQAVFFAIRWIWNLFL